MKSRLIKIVILCSFVFMSYSNVFGQDLTITVHDTYILNILGSEMVFAVDLTNNSTLDMCVSIVRRENNVLENWSSSLCFDNCFAPHLDSISTTADYGSTPLIAGETREISLHVFPLVIDGVGYITLDFINDANPTESYQVDFEAATVLVSVDDAATKINNYMLEQNYPNPFNPSTLINYSIASMNGSSEFVSLKVFDMLGREIATLVNKYQTAGSYSVKFNSKNYPISSGVYFYEIKTDNFHQINKMILEK